MQLERIGSGGPLVLKFDRLDDSWTASKDGKDETLNINPNRANRYLDELEKMEVSAWLPYTDATAHEALKNPVFRLKLILQSYKEAAPVQANPVPATLPLPRNRKRRTKSSRWKSPRRERPDTADFITAE